VEHDIVCKQTTCGALILYVNRRPVEYDIVCKIVCKQTTCGASILYVNRRPVEHWY